jgi:hypothetical protein
MLRKIIIHQISYNSETDSQLLPEFIPLGNYENLRPDWREFWPIKKFFESNSLDKEAFYGFFSPKFSPKTGLAGGDVIEFINQNQNASIISFSPFLDQSAFFFNVFEQGDINHPGLKLSAKLHLASTGVAFNIDSLITDHSGFIFSNYFVARAYVWEEWLKHANFLFLAAEANQTEYGELLVKKTTYLGQDIQIKIFLMERLINLIGFIKKDFSIVSYPPWKLNLTPTKFSQFRSEVLISDLIKQRYIHTNDKDYLDLFIKYRAEFIESFRAK